MEDERRYQAASRVVLHPGDEDRYENERDQELTKRQPVVVLSEAIRQKHRNVPEGP